MDPHSLTTKQCAIGQKVRAFRTARRMSLRTLGGATGTTASFLSQFERGLSGANTSTLMRIAGALGLSPTDLLDNGSQPPIAYVLRKSARPALATPAEGYRKTLLSTRPIRDMAVFYGEFEPGGSVGDKTDSHADSRELMFVIRGEIELILGDKRHVLSAGDSAEYPTSVARTTVNVGAELAEVLWTIAPPTSASADLDQHRPQLGP